MWARSRVPSEPSPTSIPISRRRCAGVSGIGFEPAATQVVQRDRHAALMQALALLASTVEQAAVEFRHLARTEVREIEEEFGEGAERLLGDAAQTQPLAL